VEDTKPNEKLSELQLGIRELFRILVPGAYVMFLLSIYAPQNPFVQLAEKGTTSLLVASLFFGLVGYALRVHERCFPYFMVFEEFRKPLNEAIIEVTSRGASRDNIDVYKYFLETSDSPLRYRIHYFSSFYYMLTELSFISGVTALALLISHLRLGVGEPSEYLAWGASIIVLLGISVQVLLLWGLAGLRGKIPVAISIVPVCFCFAGVLILSMIVGWSRFLSCFMENYAVPAFFLLAFAFERLGAKHWNQIICEQIVFVRHHAIYLVEISNKQGSNL